jgi:DNA-binding NarL/FixJ family response regulator
MSRIRVAIADDHFEAVDGLTKAIANTDDMIPVGSANRLLDITTLIRKERPDILVLDLAWPADKQAGIKLIPLIREVSPETQILAITVYPELVDVAADAGAYPLRKGFSKEEFLEAIRWLVNNKHTSSSLSHTQKSCPLTDREKDVLRLVAEGKTDKDIGKVLNIVDGTVKKHIRSILEKSDTTNRTEAAVKAIRNKWL